MSALAEAVLATFDSNPELRWDLRSSNELVALFDVAEAEVTTTFERIEGIAWRFSFDVQPPKTLPLTMAIRVFSGAFQAVREFLEVWQPEKLVFAQESEDLGGLYETFLLKKDTTLHYLGYRMAIAGESDLITELTIVQSIPSGRNKLH